MPNYKVIYFGVRGYAETIRLVFAAAGVAYDDNRIEMKDWMVLKPTMPFGQLPVLEVDGMKLAQSDSICRFLADKFGLMGRHPIEKAAIDACAETISEIRVIVMRVQTNMDIPQDVKDKEMKVVLEEKVPPILEKLEVCLKKNKSGDKYFYGDTISLADIHFFACCETVVRLNPKAFDNFPKLAALYDRVKNHSHIYKWLQQRPDTPV
ncbi:hypothetical protein LSH36_365g05030 [Paralvinella palmiformis]|uniref:glutathione transferase n=1 Tax=Paralvinella palmiformis TaxID=53620 RepID=A0AAD9N231_9ANNE|nr:hypothetical protein LSH36_365g05030 [Paralvinella palmiformis]